MLFVTEKQLSELLCISHGYIWKCRQQGMPYKRLGSRSVRYDLESVLKWFDKYYERKDTYDQKRVG